ncbi:Protein CBG07533 [Caenorhabditis briggsae]|uniref:Protein CBG07533 n=1 Tax=Caenorhabditis briggsae TaxID=6238 RepID=A8X4M0_CAEBR|nr:Protein CBG07533 [Caenorhabditis briggsae]CAP27580.1 Protein CBG07533 [Caenorhabditis briggsae]
MCIKILDIETSDGTEIAQLMTWIDVNTITSLRIHTNQLMLSNEDVEEFIETPHWQRIRNFQLVDCLDLPHNILNNLGNKLY